MPQAGVGSCRAAAGLKQASPCPCHTMQACWLLSEVAAPLLARACRPGGLRHAACQAGRCCLRLLQPTMGFQLPPAAPPARADCSKPWALTMGFQLPSAAPPLRVDCSNACASTSAPVPFWGPKALVPAPYCWYGPFCGCCAPTGTDLDCGRWRALRKQWRPSSLVSSLRRVGDGVLAALSAA